MTNDPYARLDIQPRFDLDEAELHRKFIAASAATHPDRFTDPIDQADAADRAAAINEAYRILADPERRANALLVLRGGAAKEDDKSLPPDLLMEIMEVRERMEDAIAGNDAAEIDAMRQWADAERANRLSEIAALFETNDLPGVRLQLNALRYIERMIEQMPEPDQ